MSLRGRAISGGVVLAAQITLRVGTTFILAPLLLHFEDQETLGFYSVILQIVAYLQLLELGITRALAREISQCGDGPELRKKLGRLAATGILFLAIVGLVGFLATAIVARALPFYFSARTPVLRSAETALLVFAAWMPLRFPLSFFHLFLFARQRIALYGGLTAAGDALRFLVSLALVAAGWGLPGLALAFVMSELLTFALSWHAARREFRGCSWRTRPAAAELRPLLAIGVPLSLMGLGDRLIYFSQDIVAGALFDAAAVAVIYAARMPGITLASIVWRAAESATPGLNELYGRKLMEAFRSAHHRLVGYIAGLALWLGAGIMVFNRPVVEFWLGPALCGPASLTAGVACFAAVSTVNNILTWFLIVEGRLTYYPAVVFGAGLSGVALALAIGPRWGPPGVVWATCVATVLVAIFLLHRNRLMLGSGFKDMLAALSGRAVRCAAAGVAACGVYAAAVGMGLSIPWIAGFVAVMAPGAWGFIQFGLVAEDRTYLKELWSRILERARIGGRS